MHLLLLIQNIEVMILISYGLNGRQIIMEKEFQCMVNLEQANLKKVAFIQ
jgi:hypothetical protein